jgi:hypothetical protein
MPFYSVERAWNWNIFEMTDFGCTVGTVLRVDELVTQSSSSCCFIFLTDLNLNLNVRCCSYFSLLSGTPGRMSLIEFLSLTCGIMKDHLVKIHRLSGDDYLPSPLFRKGTQRMEQRKRS